MAAILKVNDVGGIVRTIQQVTARDMSGTVRDIQAIHVRDVDNVSRLVFQKPGGSSSAGALTVAPTPAAGIAVKGSKISTGAAVTITANASVAVSGGTAPYTYLWEPDHGVVGAVTITTPALAATGFSATLVPPDVAGGYFRCTVTDASGLKVVTVFPVNLSAILQS